MHCAKTIKRIRMALYLQQSEFAEKLGLSLSAISNYEAGRRMPRLPIARKIKAYADKNGIIVEMEDLVK